MATQVDLALVAAYKQFRQEFESVIELDTLDSTRAIEAVTNLASIVLDYRDAFCMLENQEKLSKFLREKPIAYFPILERVIEALNNPSIQFNDPLKKSLARTARILLELTTFHCIQQKRAVYKETSQRISDIFKEIKKTLPEEEVECRYEIGCCKALAKKLDFGDGYEKELAKKHFRPLLQAVIEGVTAINLSADGGAPAAMVTPLVGPVIDLIIDIYNTIPVLWYRGVWALRWCSIEKRITTIERLNHFKASFMINGFYKQHPKIRYFLCQVLFEIARNPNLDEEVRLEAFQTGEISILGFAKRTFLSNLLDPFWETRYQAIAYLETLSTYPQFRNDCLWTMLRKWCSKRERRAIKKLGGTIYERTILLYPGGFIPDERIQEANNQIGRPREEIEQEIQEIEEDLQASQGSSSIQEQSTGQDSILSESEMEELTDKLADYYDELDTLEAFEYLKSL